MNEVEPFLCCFCKETPNLFNWFRFFYYYCILVIKYNT